ncbi:MAG: chemotaxis protein CheW [Rhodoferax sp.]|nr:chemotaxis protein CheW [Rhodoferax sp.]
MHTLATPASNANASAPSRSPVGAAAVAEVADEVAHSSQWLRLTVGDIVYALPIEHVREILQVGRMTTLPRVPPVIRGVMNLRGAVVPVIDLGARLTQRPVAVGRRSCIIVVDLPPQDDRASLVAGVMVDAVFEVIDVDQATVSPTPPLGAPVTAAYLSGVVTAQGRRLHLLDLPRVLSQRELTELVASHAG